MDTYTQVKVHCSVTPNYYAVFRIDARTYFKVQSQRHKLITVLRTKYANTEEKL